MNKTLVVGLVVVVSIGAYLFVAGGGLKVDYSSATLIFEKSSGWGPCESGDECGQHIYLYSNGVFVVEGKDAGEKNIGAENVERFVEAIRNSGVIGKECEGGQVIDVSTTYKIYLDSTITTIKFPGCDEELTEVDEMLNEFEK